MREEHFSALPRRISAGETIYLIVERYVAQAEMPVC